MMRNRRCVYLVSGLLSAVILPMTASAADDIGTLERQVEQLQQQLKVVQDRLDEQSMATSSMGTDDTLSAVHLSGYAAVGYTDGENANGAFNTLSFNPIFHYMYRDRFLLEAELEFEVDEDGETETALEYATIDWFINDNAVLQAGKFLSPIGQFRQSLHPAWINKFASAPPGFGHDGAAPLAEVGVQLRGGFRISESWRLNYAVYAGNGPRVEIEGTELHAIDSEGSTGNDDDRLTYGGRVGIRPVATFELGLSAAGGEVGPIGEETLLRDYIVYGADFNWQPGKDWDFRGEYVKSTIDSNTASVAPDSADWKTSYIQGAYRILSSKWEAVLRYADFDTPHEGELKQWGSGLNYWIAPNAVAKMNYESNDGSDGNTNDDNRLLLQLAYGF